MAENVFVDGHLKADEPNESDATDCFPPPALEATLGGSRAGIISSSLLFSVAPPKCHGSETAAIALEICNPCIDAVFRYAFEEPRILCSFLNAALDLKGDRRIDWIEKLPQELPSSDPSSLVGYRFTVDVRCRSKDGRHFLIEIQNDFRDDYHLKCLIEHSRMISRLDTVQTLEEQSQLSQRNRNDKLKFWEGIQGVYTIVITNKSFPVTPFKSQYADEALMEPFLVNAHELRHVEQVERHYGDIPNQIILLMMDRLEKEATDLTTSIERWAYVFKDKSMRSGATKIIETKTIEEPEVIAGDDEAILAFFERLSIGNIPQGVRERYLREISYFNDSIADIREQGFNEGVRNVAAKMLKFGMPVSEILALTGLTADMIEIS
jgi:predicted transposase/invertase (TIGR01784 family)